MRRKGFDICVSKGSDHDHVDHRGNHSGGVRNGLSTTKLRVLSREEERAASELGHTRLERYARAG